VRAEVARRASRSQGWPPPWPSPEDGGGDRIALVFGNLVSDTFVSLSQSAGRGRGEGKPCETQPSQGLPPPWPSPEDGGGDRILKAPHDWEVETQEDRSLSEKE
jgi:hypothetical protein